MNSTVPSWQILEGDCVSVMASMKAETIDAICTDPPYGLSREPEIADVLTRWLAGKDYEHRGRGFMGRSWDAFVPGPAIWREALRVLKPGGHLLAFGGPRTFDLLVTAIRLAGFEIRDTLMWLYGSGLPKSLDVSKAIDKATGEARGHAATGTTLRPTPESMAWDGWGTALKPAHEPIVLARKPLGGTVAVTVLAHGTGALNIEACRINFVDSADERESKNKNRHGDFGTEHGGNHVYGDYSTLGARGNYDAPGRWPANIILDPAAAELLDDQAGERARGNHPARRGARGTSRKVYGSGWSSGTIGEARATESGGASRFFYCAKTSRRERDAGLDDFDAKLLGGFSDGQSAERPVRNHHPTVKPIELMRWLLRLVTPPRGVVLDPFAGSGSTVCAGVLERITVVGVELDSEYVRIARARAKWWQASRSQRRSRRALARERD